MRWETLEGRNRRSDEGFEEVNLGVAGAGDFLTCCQRSVPHHPSLFDVPVLTAQRVRLAYAMAIATEVDINLYGYVWDNPTRYTDPSGLAAKSGGPWHPPPKVPTSCRPSDDCSALTRKISVLTRMLASHMGWDRVMGKPRGGNRHATEIRDLWTQWARCQAIYLAKCVKAPITTFPTITCPIITFNPCVFMGGALCRSPEPKLES